MLLRGFGGVMLRAPRPFHCILLQWNQNAPASGTPEPSFFWGTLSLFLAAAAWQRRDWLKKRILHS